MVASAKATKKDPSKRKMKLIALLHILESQTSASEGLTMPQLIDRLAQQGIPAERKALYRDIDVLRSAGYDIQKLPMRPVQYALVRTELGIDDVMMLVDAVQSSRFLTQRKSQQLVNGLKGLVSEKEQRSLEKRVHVHNRVKRQTDSVFHNVDLIHKAIKAKRKIDFSYFSYDKSLRRKARHGGKRYVLTPVAVIYADANYYLAAYDDEDDAMKTYRVDRMELLQMSDEPATRCPAIANYECDEFAYQSFGMFHGKSTMVTLRVEEALMDAIVDRFGADVAIAKEGTDYADVRVKVQVSPQFFGWVAGLDGHVGIRAPKSVVEQYRNWLAALAKNMCAE